MYIYLLDAYDIALAPPIRESIHLDMDLLLSLELVIHNSKF
jgi:hypothetical protein